MHRERFWQVKAKQGGKMKGLKNFIVFVLVLASVTGCAKKGPSKLTIWVNYNDEEFLVFKELADKYQVENKLQIDIERIPFSGTEQKILTALATRTTPDIARVDLAFVPKLAKKGALAELDTLSGADSLIQNIVPAALQSVMIDGKMYGVPDQVTCLALFYNKDLFRSAGLDPDKPPKTWDEFLAYAKRLTNEKEGIFGFAMNNTLWWTLPFFYTFGADFIKDSKCALNTPEAIEAMKFKVSLYQTEKVEAGAWKAGAVDPDMGFQSGKYAMVLNGPWKIKTLTDMKINFGVGLIPSGKAQTSTAIGGTDMVIFRNSKFIAEAFKFLCWLTSKDNQVIWSDRLGQIPVHLGATPSVDTLKHPYLGVFIKQLETAHARPPLVNYSDIENAVNPEMELALNGKKTVEQALNDACAKMDALLQGEPTTTQNESSKANQGSDSTKKAN